MLYLSLFLISAASLVYEILLMRLFAIINWSQFSYFCISLALFGFAMSGVLIGIFRQPLLARFKLFYSINLWLFGVTSLFCFVVSQHVFFNPLQIFWSLTPWWYLIAIFVLLTIPFFCVANCICLAFAREKARVHLIYAADLLGAGIGAIAIVGLLYLLMPIQCLRVVSIVGFSSMIAYLCSREISRANKAWLMIPILSILLLLFGLPSNLTKLIISPYKAQSYAQHIPGNRILARYSSPLSYLTIMDNATVPFRRARGLSFYNPVPLPHQLAVFVDGNGPYPLMHYDAQVKAYLQHKLSSLPYYLLNQPEVVIADSMTGQRLLQAKAFHAKKITVLQEDPNLMHLIMQTDEVEQTEVNNQQHVHFVHSSIRNFIAKNKQSYNLLILPDIVTDSVAAGVLNAASSYPITIQAFAAYLKNVSAQGMIAISIQQQMPPRALFKLLVTIKTAMQQLGYKDIERHLILMTHWDSSILLLKKTDFNQLDYKNAGAFATKRGFDLIFPLQHAVGQQVNAPHLKLIAGGVAAILSQGGAQYIKRYPFNIAVANDSNPFFYDYFRWRNLKEHYMGHFKSGFLQMQWGYLIITLTLIAAIVLSLLLLILPLIIWYRRQKLAEYTASNVKPKPNMIYFLLLGLGFMLIEMTYIQKMQLYFNNPMLAITIVIATFLIFAGLGSAFSYKMFPLKVKKLLFIIFFISIICFFIQMHLFIHLLGTSMAIKLITMVTFIAPQAFLLGMPFPLGLTLLTRSMPVMIPWAWGMNGAASVIAAILAVLLLAHFSLNMFWSLGVVSSVGRAVGF